jgi:phage gpG-like protein
MAKSGVTFKTKDGRPLDVLVGDITKIAVISAAEGINEIMTQIGHIAVGKHMINSGGVANSPTDPTRLMIRIGRLARSVANAFTFSISKLPTVKQLRSGIRPKTKSKLGLGKKEGFRKIFWDRLRNVVNGKMGSNVPYAAVHEFGGTAGRGGKTVLKERSYLRKAKKDVKPRFASIIDKFNGKNLKKTGWQ